MIYLDNSATTPIDPEVLDAMMPYLKEEFGNPSSRYYTLSVNADNAVESAREKVSRLINCKPEEIIFTAGASESNNLIIKGILDYKKHYENGGNHVITSTVEHKSIIQTCKFLNGEIFLNKEKNKRKSFVASPKEAIKVDRGYECTFLPVNEYGQVESSDFSNSIKDSTVLASFMWANNEIGSINDIKSLCQIAKEKNILFHSDATQAIGKLIINTQEIPVDFLSFSAHKIHGPKGIGAAFLRKVKYSLPNMTALIHGGLQEDGYRAGTHAVHNIVGFGKAAEIALRDMTNYIKNIKALEEKTRKLLKNKYPNIIFIGDTESHLPGFISIILPGVINEMLIKKLSNDIAISSGSACSIGEPSYVIDAIGKSSESSNFIRLAINKNTTLDDLEKAISLM